MIWFLACMGVIYIVVDLFGEGSTSATVAGIGVFLVSAYYFSKNR